MPEKNIKVVKYDDDFYMWSKTQAKLLKRGEFTKLDIANLTVEIESLGRSEKRTLESFLINLLLHMLKIRYQPGKHTRSWDLSIKNSKHKAQVCLKENPSLKKLIPELIKEAYFTARLRAIDETGLEDKIFPNDCPWKAKDLF